MVDLEAVGVPVDEHDRLSERLRPGLEAARVFGSAVRNGLSCQAIMTPGLPSWAAWSKAALIQATSALIRALVSLPGLRPSDPGRLTVAKTTLPCTQRAFSG